MADSRYCAPHRVDMLRSTGSCLTHRELKIIADAFNFEYRDQIPKKAYASKSTLWKALGDKLRASCSDLGEHCWVQKVGQTPSLIDLRRETFRPMKPASWYANSNEWLNTYDILLVMRQYEKAHSDFKFVGVFPRDFASKPDGEHCVSREMCDMEIFNKQHKRFGFVFNHDMSNQPGSHWVAMFMSFDASSKLHGVHYFDSTGDRPKNEVVEFMSKMSSSRSLPASTRSTRKQFKNTECGMFALDFLIKCIDAPPGRSYADVVKSIGNDKDLEALRDRIYTPNYTFIKVKRPKATTGKALEDGRTRQ